MLKKTHHIGENSVDESITKLQKTISTLGFHIVEHSCSNPIDNIWSIRISDENCQQLTSHGSGISKQEALLDALISFSEHLLTHYFWSNHYLGDKIANNKVVHFSNEKWCHVNSNGSWPSNVLNEELHDLYNPLGELNTGALIDIGSSNPVRGICCIPFENIQTNDEVYFPLNILDNIYTNNGIASSYSVKETQNKALFNILKNFIQFKVIAEGISLPNIPNSILELYPDIQKHIDDIENLGFSILIKDASLNGKYPVVQIILLDPNTQGICTSFGSHPDFKEALFACFKEIARSHHLNKMNSMSMPKAGFDIDEISSPKNLSAQFNESRGIIAWRSLSNNSQYEFYDWRSMFTTTNEDEIYQQLCELIQSDGNEIFIAEYEVDDLYACRIIVPGMSEVYPVDDLVWENNNTGMNVRDQILKKNKSLNDCEKLIEDLEDLDLDDELLISTLIGMPSDDDSIFLDLNVAELILLLALKTQDNERIQEGCEWVLDHRKTNPYRLKTYKCINTILQLDDMTNYSVSLEKLYTKEILKNVLALIDGEDVFPLESEWRKQGLLIEAYEKITRTS